MGFNIDVKVMMTILAIAVGLISAVLVMDMAWIAAPLKYMGFLVMMAFGRGQ